MARVVQQNIDMKLTKQNVIDSLNEEIYRFPFNNNLFEAVFPFSTRKLDDNSIVIEMSDGTTFKLQVTKM